MDKIKNQIGIHPHKQITIEFTWIEQELIKKNS